MIKQLFTLPLEDDLLLLWIISAGVFLVSFLIQMNFLFRFYKKLPAFRKLNEKSQDDPVSVIICAKNQADNLKRFLPAVLNQIYPEFEVIVVNDGSSDETEEILAEFKSTYPHLYVTGLEGRPGHVTGKKAAQTIGIKAAHHDQMIFTNPDCEPLSPHWLKHMQSNFLQRTNIILGYGGYKSRRGLLNKLIRADTVYFAMQYLSFAIKGIPFMGTSRNIAYRKSHFFAHKGFASHLHFPSGDDDLFVNETANRYNTAVEIDPDSFTLTEPLYSWKKWFRQQRKFYSTRSRYRKKHRRLLILEVLSREIFFISGIFLLIFWKLPAYIIFLFLIREISFSIIFKQVMKRLTERNLLLLSIIYDIIWPFFAGLLIFRNRFSEKSSKWK